MCRNIKTLFNFEPPATAGEVRAAALQFVRKVSGFQRPAKANEAAFEAAVEEIAESAQRLLAELKTAAPPRDREVEAARARARSAQRFGSGAVGVIGSTRMDYPQVVPLVRHTAIRLARALRGDGRN
jgi:hypothetical protein